MPISTSSVGALAAMLVASSIPSLVFTPSSLLKVNIPSITLQARLRSRRNRSARAHDLKVNLEHSRPQGNQSPSNPRPPWPILMPRESQPRQALSKGRLAKTQVLLAIMKRVSADALHSKARRCRADSAYEQARGPEAEDSAAPVHLAENVLPSPCCFSKTGQD